MVCFSSVVLRITPLHTDFCQLRWPYIWFLDSQNWKSSFTFESLDDFNISNVLAKDCGTIPAKIVSFLVPFNAHLFLVEKCIIFIKFLYTTFLTYLIYIFLYSMNIHKDTKDIRAHKFYTIPRCISDSKCRTGKLKRKVFQQTALHYLKKTNIFVKFK